MVASGRSPVSPCASTSPLPASWSKGRLPLFNRPNPSSRVMTSHAVPLGFFLDQDLLDIVLFEQGESALETMLLRLDGWRDDAGPMDAVSLLDRTGVSLRTEPRRRGSRSV